jgi:hypothetical protein
MREHPLEALDGAHWSAVITFDLESTRVLLPKTSTPFLDRLSLMKKKVFWQLMFKKPYYIVNTSNFDVFSNFISKRTASVSKDTKREEFLCFHQI